MGLAFLEKAILKMNFWAWNFENVFFWNSSSENVFFERVVWKCVF